MAGERHGNGLVCVNPSLKRQGNSRGTAWEQHGNGMGTAWERHGMCESALSSPSYPASNAHAPDCHLLSAWINSTFPHHVNGTILEKVTEHEMWSLIFSTAFA
jgi:hypothetical protein